MNSDTVFKNAAVGGFKKKDVMDYIELVLTELANCREQLKEKDERIAELEARLGSTAPKLPATTSTNVRTPAEISAAIDSIVSFYLGNE